MWVCVMIQRSACGFIFKRFKATDQDWKGLLIHLRNIRDPVH